MNDLEYIKSLLWYLEGHGKRPEDSPLLTSFDKLLEGFPDKFIQQYCSIKEFVTPKMLRTDINQSDEKPDIKY